MFDVINIKESERRIVSSLADFVEAVDDCMGSDASRWISNYVDALEAGHETELADIKEEYEDKLSEVRRDRDDRIAEMEEHYAH